MTEASGERIVQSAIDKIKQDIKLYIINHINILKNFIIMNQKKIIIKEGRAPCGSGATSQ